jgi:CheY-like chemotaxis protein
VSDTGPGIAPQVLAQLFQRFTQGDGSLQRKHGGAGLGLQISRELARLMGGDIEARSQLGAGSVFTLRLPLQPAHSAQGAPANATALSPASSAPTTLRVLVADDNEVNRLYMEGALNLLQHHCTLVDDGEQALQAANEQRFDVIFLDLHMPQRDGFSTATALRANLAGPNVNTPLVALTADVFDDTRQRCKAAGMNAFLAKPASPQDIARCLAEWVPHAPAAEAPSTQAETVA